MGCCESREKQKDELTLSLEDQLKLLSTTKRVKLRAPEQLLTSVQSSGESRIVETPVIHQSIASLVTNTTEPLDSRWELVYADTVHPSQLNIYLQGTIIRSEWIVPCTPSKFIQWMNNTTLQKQLDSKIDELYAFEKDIVEQEFKMYLSYKSFLIVSPREFVYQKRIKCLDIANDVTSRFKNKIWVDSSQSIEDEKHPLLSTKVRALIHLSGHMVQPLKLTMEQQGLLSRFVSVPDASKYSHVRMYSNSDTKLKVPAKLFRSQTIHEIQNYVQKAHKLLEEL